MPEAKVAARIFREMLRLVGVALLERHHPEERSGTSCGGARIAVAYLETGARLTPAASEDRQPDQAQHDDQGERREDSAFDAGQAERHRGSESEGGHPLEKLPHHNGVLDLGPGTVAGDADKQLVRIAAETVAPRIAQELHGGVGVAVR
jgi:hypothetical protein